MMLMMMTIMMTTPHPPGPTKKNAKQTNKTSSPQSPYTRELPNILNPKKRNPKTPKLKTLRPEPETLTLPEPRQNLNPNQRIVTPIVTFMVLSPSKSKPPEPQQPPEDRCARARDVEIPRRWLPEEVTQEYSGLTSKGSFTVVFKETYQGFWKFGGPE